MKHYNAIIPESIARHGIKHLVGQHEPGQQVQLPTGLIFSFFKEELCNEFITGGEAIQAHAKPRTHKHKR